MENEAVESRRWNADLRPRNGASRKRSSNRRNSKTSAFRFCVDGNHLENNDVTMMSQSTYPVIVAFLNSSRVVWTQKKLMGENRNPRASDK